MNDQTSRYEAELLAYFNEALPCALYDAHFHLTRRYAEKKGYSGTAIFTKHTPLSVRYGIGVPELDNEGRVVTLEYENFYLVTCYTPNAQVKAFQSRNKLAGELCVSEYKDTIYRIFSLIGL